MTGLAVVGEVQTSLLQNSAPLSPDMAEDLLQSLLDGETIPSLSRPVAVTWSPGLLTGVDCLAPSVRSGGRRNRVIGTVRSVVSLVEGQLLQVSSSTELRPNRDGRRLPWSHYLAQPGVIELAGAAPGTEVAKAFLHPYAQRDELDLGAVNRLRSAAVHDHPMIDHEAPFPAGRTRVRWVATSIPIEGQHAHLKKVSEDTRTLSLQLPEDFALPSLLERISDFCADLALHDWLLATLQDVVRRALHGSRSSLESLRRLRPVIDSLAHTWMPGARTINALRPMWGDVESGAKLTAQWETALRRVRDQIQFWLAERLLDVSAPSPVQES